MLRRLFAASTLVTLLLCGCAGYVAQPAPPAETGGDYSPLTLPFVAMGDTQEHLATGYPLVDNDSAVDAYVEVAQRPPEQTLFGRRVLEWALHAVRQDDYVLHLGDVMDLSCRIEAYRMGRIFFAAGPDRVAILPGNHDGLLFGIYAFSLLDPEINSDARRWNHVCRRGAAPDDRKHKTANEAFTKRDLIAYYLRQQGDADPAEPGAEPPTASGDGGREWRNPKPGAFLSRVQVRLREGIRYADSFIAQRLRLQRAPGATRDVVVIGLDTNQAGALVSAWDTLMGRSPGSRGHVKHDQVAVVGRWVDEAVANGDIVVFAGHHNWTSLGLQSRALLADLMSKLDHPLVYVSAHTHRGFWAEHRIWGRRPLLEMNVSSLSDWPIAYRRIRFAYDEKARRLRVRADLLPEGDTPSRSYADLLAAWEKQTCAASGVAPRTIRAEDLALVTRQRESRGSLVEWLLSKSLSVVCETCDGTVYDHAQRYQDELLETLIQVGDDLGRDAHRLAELPLPAWCEGRGYAECARSLIAQRADGYPANVALFRRKATLVSLLNDHLDELDSTHARAYMTCRAVQAAKIDFDMTPEGSNNYRGEALRAKEQFFRIEASVGMD